MTPWLQPEPGRIGGPLSDIERADSLDQDSDPGIDTPVCSQNSGNSEDDPVIRSRYSRLANVDRLRLLGAMGVVWFHLDMSPARTIGYSGLPALIMISIALSARDNRPITTKSFAIKKAKRLMVPWVFWGCIYVLVLFLKAFFKHVDLHDFFKPHMFLTGPSVHLWYLPYAFVALLCVRVIQQRVPDVPSSQLVLWGMSLGAVSLVACSLATAYGRLEPPVAQWVFGLPAAPLGYAVGHLSRSSTRISKSILWAIGIASAAVLFLILVGHSGFCVPYGIAIALVILAFQFPGRMDSFSERAGPLAYGIYLVHPLVASALHFLAGNMFSAWQEIGLVLLVSGVFTQAILQTGLRRIV